MLVSHYYNTKLYSLESVKINNQDLCISTVHDKTGHNRAFRHSAIESPCGSYVQTKHFISKSASTSQRYDTL